MKMVFILGSPRTGSTLLYQIMINHFSMIYFNNLTNDEFPLHPSTGLQLSLDYMSKVEYESRYGKTKGAFGPSEGSAIFSNWFGDTDSFLSDEKRTHMYDTFRNIDRMSDRPIVMKNLWNYNRIKSIIARFPDAKFVWIQRTLSHAAHSDLQSRRNKGDMWCWNSAPVPNKQEIQKLHPCEQVVEQQMAYNEIISRELDMYCEVRNQCHVWYEDLCDDLPFELNELGIFLGIKPLERVDFFPASKPEPDIDYYSIQNFIQEKYRK